MGQAFFTAQWLTISLGENLVKLSTVLIFDVGVYLTVVGTLVTMFIALADTQLSDEQLPPDEVSTEEMASEDIVSDE